MGIDGVEGSGAVEAGAGVEGPLAGEDLVPGEAGVNEA